MESTLIKEDSKENETIKEQPETNLVEVQSNTETKITTTLQETVEQVSDNSTTNIVNTLDNAEESIKLPNESNDDKIEKNENQPSIFEQPNNIPNTLRELFESKTDYLGNYYLFSQAYSSDVIVLCKKLMDVIGKKVRSTLNQNKVLLKFFKELIGTYKRFSTELIATNAILNSQNTDIKDSLIEENVSKIYESIEIDISKSVSTFSGNLYKVIIAKGSFERVDEFLARLESIEKNIHGQIFVISSKSDKIKKLFNSKYGILFDNINRLGSCNQDMFLVELELTRMFNSQFEKSGALIACFKEQMNNVKTLLIDYLNFLKETMEVFLNETKNIFPLNAQVEAAQKLFEQIKLDTVENNLSLNKFINNELSTEFNGLLQNYRLNFLKFKIAKSSIAQNEEKFKVDNIKNLNDLFELFLELNPQPITHLNDFVAFTAELKRDPGVFKSWKHTVLIVTKQKNVILFDEVIKKKNLGMLNVDRLVIRMKEDKKNPYRLEISENKKGIIFNSNVSFVLDAITKENLENIKQWLDSKNNLVEETLNEDSPHKVKKYSSYTGKDLIKEAMKQKMFGQRASAMFPDPNNK